MLSAADPSTPRSACIVGLAGHELLPDEARFLATYRPCGIIIFSRNFSSNAQLRRLIDAARDAAGVDSWLVLVDQEGGRVQRLRGAGWPNFPPAAAFGTLYEADAVAGLEAARLSSQWLASLLRDVGINTNCAPCLDVPVPGADAIIGDRAYGDHATVVSAVGKAVADGMMVGGVVPVIKHIPGHGRAELDSHLALPVVDTGRAVLSETDFATFSALRNLPAAMSAHVVFSAFDDAAPASISKRMIQEIMRQDIGFDGLLMSDDVSMRALRGTIGERSQAVLVAGSDIVLHCNGIMAEMLEVAAVTPKLSGDALRRYQRCLEIVQSDPTPVEADAARIALGRVTDAAAARETAAIALG